MKTKKASVKSQPTARQPLRRRTAATHALKLKRILVPLDFSGKSRQALATAIPLAALTGGKIILLHVVQPPLIPTVPDAPSYVPNVISDLAQGGTNLLAKMALKLVPPEYLAQTMVRIGSPSAEIVAAAREVKADLVVIASKGRTGLSRILLGSTAEHVVRHAHCPVLTVRRH